MKRSIKSIAPIGMDLWLESAKEGTQVTNIRNKRVDIAREHTDIKKLIKEYCELLYANKFGNVDEKDNSLKSRISNSNTKRN